MALAGIEAIVENVVDSVNRGCAPSITLKNRRQRQTTKVSLDCEKLEALPSRTCSFPGRNEQESWYFAVQLRVLQLIHGALTQDIVLTKRDMFYQDPTLFGSQSVVDRVVDDIACTLQVPRASLNVAAAAKGLFAGAVTISRSDGLVLCGASECEGMLIPDLRNTISISAPEVQWLVMVEKEATFQELVGGPFRDILLSEGVLITGKGEPDIFTRYLTRMLSHHFKLASQTPTPIFALVDYDPHGIGIMSTYKHGSRSLPHENGELATQDISWLGLRSGDVFEPSPENTHQTPLELSVNDRKRATSMLSWPHLAESGCEKEWRRELQVMLMLNYKAEIQFLGEQGVNLSHWLQERITIGVQSNSERRPAFVDLLLVYKYHNRGQSRSQTETELHC